MTHVVPADPHVVVATVKKKAQPSRSWVLLDSNGETTVLDVDKYAIMHRVNIHARDLRILDPLLSYPSTILGRDGAIVLNLEHIKAIITSEEVLLRDPSDEYVVPVVQELQRRLPLANAINQGHETSAQIDVDAGVEDASPFEFRALEVALESICSFLAARTLELETTAYPALDELTSLISSRNLDRVRKMKSAMTRLTARVQKVRDELEQLLDDDDDMADLYLSRKLASASPVSGSGAVNWYAVSPTIGSKISRASRASIATLRGDENDVEELEMLLEVKIAIYLLSFNDLFTPKLSQYHSVLQAYFMQVDGTLNKLATLPSSQLDNHRNQLIQLELFLSAGTVSLALYSLVTAIFGMNIPYTWNEGHDYMFKWVVGVSGLLSAIVFILIMSYARFKGLVGS
ncbi:hypothetical protein V6N12_054902 [Hibiscus sabdariffa]|uniref:Magnesium transporter n=1 Tax=Hibiscus sabdariffa TaxID=183260 RepID=A0ABR2D2L3_9ROSI